MSLKSLLENKNYKAIATFLKHHPEERSFLLQQTQHIPNNTEIKNNELVYIIVNNLKDKPKCICGKDLVYVKPNVGYKITCGDKVCIDTIAVEKRSKTNKKRYGGKTPMSSPKVREKVKQTIKEKYGVDSVFDIDGVKEKTIKTNIDKYGTEWSSQSEVIKEKSKNNLLDKWGVDCTQKLDFVKDKTKKTNLDKYGSEEFFGAKINREKIKSTWDNKYGGHPLRSDKVKNKIVKTTLEKWGVTHVSKTKLVKDKISKALTKRWLEFMSIDDKNFIRKDEDGYYILFCEETGKEYKINPVTYNRRKRNGEVISTYLNPINKSYSKGETELFDYINSIYDGEILKNNREILGGYELDIVIPELKLAFEYNGMYWHSEENKPKKYHQNKFLKCGEVGYRLIQIWEDEWQNENKKIKSYINHIIGKSDKKIYARKCDVKLIEPKEYKKFCELNHLQGYARAKHKIGLYYKDELVSVMSFCTPRVKSKEVIEYEMIRFCNKLGYSVIGSASKIFKFFLDEIKPKSIITYSDMDKFNSNLYVNLGFQFVGFTEPSYFYYYNGERVNRFKLRRSNVIKENIDITKYVKVFTSGNKKFLWRSSF